MQTLLIRTSNEAYARRRAISRDFGRIRRHMWHKQTLKMANPEPSTKLD